MIALTVLQSWGLIVLVAVALWATWGVLNIVFAMIERWHRR